MCVIVLTKKVKTQNPSITYTATYLTGTINLICLVCIIVALIIAFLNGNLDLKKLFNKAVTEDGRMNIIARVMLSSLPDLWLCISAMAIC